MFQTSLFHWVGSAFFDSSPPSVTCVLAVLGTTRYHWECEDEVVVFSEAAPSVREEQLPVVSRQLSGVGEGNWVTTLLTRLPEKTDRLGALYA